ncbi:serine acetyltransferase [Lewinellaceae bacterium SD302]|nr:serine acetyltransferase [Lewinellaceae bacterium SD302]
MDENFIHQLYLDHQRTAELPSPRLVEDWLNRLLQLLFPEYSEEHFASERVFAREFETNALKFLTILDVIRDKLERPASEVQTEFYAGIPAMRQSLMEDATAILNGDPAAKSTTEVIRTYPGFFTLAVFRVANSLCRLGVPLIPRVLTEHAHMRTGIDIHPGATIGRRFCIDHGTGIVIGETVEIGDDVKIYQGVTLGALSVDKSLARTKRHPTIEDRVVIYAGATILGGDTVIGEDSVIGGNTWITKSVAAGSKVYYRE